jgi:hypothetical protein
MVKLLGKALWRYNPERRSIGPATDAIILHHSLASGSLTGPRMRLSVIPEGAGEWCTIRGDGIISIESRFMLQTPLEELVYATVAGMYDAGEDGYVDALDGTLSVAAPANVVIRFFTSAKNYLWLNKTQYVGTGERDFSSRTLTLRVFDSQGLNRCQGSGYDRAVPGVSRP